MRGEYKFAAQGPYFFKNVIPHRVVFFKFLACIGEIVVSAPEGFGQLGKIFVVVG